MSRQRIYECQTTLIKNCIFVILYGTACISPDLRMCQLMPLHVDRIRYLVIGTQLARQPEPLFSRIAGLFWHKGLSLRGRSRMVQDSPHHYEPGKPGAQAQATRFKGFSNLRQKDLRNARNSNRKSLFWKCLWDSEGDAHLQLSSRNVKRLGLL